MTSLRRLAPLSLALSVLLAASAAAAAAPATKQAGPGLVQRTKIHAGLGLTQASLALKEKGGGIVSGLRSMGAALAGMKDRALGKLAAFRAARAGKRAERRALNAANKEIEAFIKTQPIEVRSVLAHAKQENGVRSAKVWRNVNVGFAVANAALAATISPLNAAVAPISATAAALSHRDLKRSRQKAYTAALAYAVSRPGTSVPGDKLEAWVAAGAIKDFLE
jgi:hypothetical protein